VRSSCLFVLIALLLLLVLASPALEIDMLQTKRWLNFDPVVSGTGSWWMNKLGTVVSPLEVMVNGSQAQHAVGRDSSIFYGNTTNANNVCRP
jgi:hypothetical protein